MSRRWRIFLLLWGLSLVCCSLVAWLYAFWPVDVANLQATLAPTIFVAP